VAATIALEVATPLGKMLETETDSVQVPSVSGEFGVLENHVPLLAALRPGILQYRDGTSMVRVAVGGGYVEADAHRVRLITEFFARRDDVNVDQTRKDLEAAEARLKAHTGPTSDVEHQEATRDLQWALARLELAGGESN